MDFYCSTKPAFFKEKCGRFDLLYLCRGITELEGDEDLVCRLELHQKRIDT